MMDNVNEFLERIPVRNSVSFIITYNNLSVTSLHKLLEAILQLRKEHSKTYQRVWFDIPLLRQPPWQQITLLPNSYQEIHKNNIEWMRRFVKEDKGYAIFKDFEIQKMLRNLAYWRTHKYTKDVRRREKLRLGEIAVDNAMKDKKNFYTFFTEHDRRRGTNFLNTFPEMEEFWQECKNA